MFNFIYYIERHFCNNTKTEAIQLALKSEVYKLRKNKRKALSLINKSIIFDNKNDTLYYSRALIYIQNQKYKKALKDINYSISLNPNIYYYYLICADIYYLLNNPKQEMYNIQKAYELMPRAELYYEYKCEKNSKNNNYTIPSFYNNRKDNIKQKYSSYKKTNNSPITKD